ncbi:MAG: hypothetical protein AAGA77_11025, partial [Bacteroidota bacterium]
HGGARRRHRVARRFFESFENSEGVERFCRAGGGHGEFHGGARRRHRVARRFFESFENSEGVERFCRAGGGHREFHREGAE